MHVSELIWFTMHRPSATELDCLQQLARDPLDLPAACTSGVLMQLISMGLIEEVTTIALPIVMRGVRYRVTSAGHAVLNQRQ